jgi:hypothetical protein
MGNPHRRTCEATEPAMPITTRPPVRRASARGQNTTILTEFSPAACYCEERSGPRNDRPGPVFPLKVKAH